jgi:hypothetical protein
MRSGIMPHRLDSYDESGTSPTSIRRISMTGAILLLAPLAVIIGCLYWVMSLGKEQMELHKEIWPKQSK